MSLIWRVSTIEVKNSWEQVVKRVLQRHEPTLVESEGKPTVVILPADDYERLVTEHEAESNKRQQLMLLDEAERFAKKVAARYAQDSQPDSIELLRELREERDDRLYHLD